LPIKNLPFKIKKRKRAEELKAKEQAEESELKLAFLR
jgi:hypothetical protein